MYSKLRGLSIAMMSLVLALAMTLSMIPMNSYAQTTKNGGGQTLKSQRINLNLI